MPDDTRPAATPSSSREDRLAAKLRENLRRRKAQARAVEAGAGGGAGESGGDALPNPGAGG